jgi:predicted acylesterase/phospholipase RssA
MCPKISKKSLCPLRVLVQWATMTSLVLGASACQTMKTRDQLAREGESDENIPSQVREMGPPRPGTPPASPLAIAVSRKKAPKVGLILGPGGAKAFAHVGVLTSLQKAKVPVESIVGLEWGAWVAAYYAQAGHPQDAEWSLSKLKSEDLPEEKGLFNTRLSPLNIDSLEKFLNSTFHVTDLTKVKIPMACPIVSAKSGRVTWIAKGDIRNAMRQCLVYPPLFLSGDSEYFAGAGEIKAAAQYLRNQGMELIIFVNVLSENPALPSKVVKDDPVLALHYHTLSRLLADPAGPVDEVITIPTATAHILDIEKRRALVQEGLKRGTMAAQRMANKYGF